MKRLALCVLVSLLAATLLLAQEPAGSPPIDPFGTARPIGAPPGGGPTAAIEPGDGGGQPQNPSAEPHIKVFQLRNAHAVDAERIVNQLFARDVRSVAADERTNSLVVRGPEEQLNIIFAILTRLDEVESRGAPSARAAAPGLPSNARTWGTGSSDSTATRDS